MLLLLLLLLLDNDVAGTVIPLLLVVLVLTFPLYPSNDTVFGDCWDVWEDDDVGAVVEVEEDDTTLFEPVVVL